MHPDKLVRRVAMKTSETDRTPLYGRPFKCKACGNCDVVLFAIEG
jgi:hypothetical protein